MGYRTDTFNYVEQLNDATKQKATVAFDDLRKEKNKTWKWISTALQMKKPEEWERWGFGLMFSDKFDAQINSKLNRESRSNDITFEEYKKQQFSNDNDEEDYSDSESSSLDSLGADEEVEEEREEFPNLYNDEWYIEILGFIPDYVKEVRAEREATNQKSL